MSIENKIGFKITEDMECTLHCIDRSQYQHRMEDYQQRFTSWKYISTYTKQQYLMLNHYLESGYVLLSNSVYFRSLSELIRNNVEVIEISRVGKVVKYINIKSCERIINNSKDTRLLWYIRFECPKKTIYRALASAVASTMIYLVKEETLSKFAFIKQTIENNFNKSDLAVSLPTQFIFGRYSNTFEIKPSFLLELFCSCNSKDEIVNFVNFAILLRENRLELEKG